MRITLLDAKRLKIDDLLKYIEDRLAELDTEKEELKEYYSKDKERRCLEYSIYQRELSEVVEVLERVSIHIRSAESLSTRPRREQSTVLLLIQSFGPILVAPSLKTIGGASWIPPMLEEENTLIERRICP